MASLSLPINATGRPVVAAFDFDGTLSRGTSGIRFYRQILGRKRFAWMAVRHFQSALCYLLRHYDEERLNRFNHVVFRGREAAAVRAEAETFARETIPRFLLPCAVAVLQAHRERGDRCVIVSRGFAWCIEPWARTLGVSDVIATELEVGTDGRLTGRMLKPSCNGEHKRTRLLKLLGDRTQWEVHAYGDSVGDLEMFRCADHAFIRRGKVFERWSS